MTEIEMLKAQRDELHALLSDVYNVINEPLWRQMPVMEKLGAYIAKAKATDRNTSVRVVSDLVPSKEIDWSTVPIPKNYKIPKGTVVIVLNDEREAEDEFWRQGTELAAFYPTDHPNHPEFKKQ